nr:hypothetical protein [Tanacetum cinerariifolium]
MLHVLRVEMVINSPWMLSKNWLVPKQTAFDKGSSNPLMADNLPKIVWFSTHHITCMKSWLVQKQTALGKDTSNPLIVDSLLKTIWFSIHHHLTIEVLVIPGQTETAVVKRSGNVTRLQALVDKKRIVISEEVVREILQLDDAEGVICLPNEEIFVGLARMGYEKPSTKLTFYKAFFSTQWKFLIHTILHSLSAKRTSWNEFSSAMASALICLSSEEVAAEVVPPTPTSPSPPSPIIPSLPPHQSPSPPQSQAAEGSSHLVQQVLDKCSTLVLRVEGLKTANAAQQLEIVKLKARVKKLERLNKVKSSKLRRLKKVDTSQRVESSEDIENVFNQGRISVDIDEGIELVEDQEKDVEIEWRHADTQAEIYNIDLDHSSKVAAASTPIPVAKPAAKPKVLRIAAAALAVSTRRRKGVVIRDPEEELHVDTPAKTPTVKDKGKGILIEDPKSMKKKDQVEMDAEYAKILHEELEKGHEEAYKNIDWNAAFDHVQAKETQYIKRYHGFKKKPQSESEAHKNMIAYLKNTKGFKMEFLKGKTYDQILLIFQAWFDANLKRKLNEEAQEADNLRIRLEIVPNEDDDVFVEAVPLAQKAPVVDYQVVVIDNKPKYKIIRADDTHQFYISFTTLLKNFNREDLETLWRIVKDKFSTKKPTNFLDEYLLLTLKTKIRLEIVPNEDDDVFVEAVPLAQKAPVVDYQVVVIDNKHKYKIIRADDTHQFYISFTTLLKNFNREDLETLWRIVKDKFSTKKPTNFLDEYLLLTLKTKFGELVKQDAIWRNQKSVHDLALVK